ncbi:virulence RhuM family protein [Aquiflexum sp. LQ15W]|uniref:virulence RhuM family protein n=1 Tax=Cognataquiflexum nitidum TaxID=2922272 RepID=UPI001F14576B|nr:virulence RhuM family protein [Cognataquiflexum nitidum]MCH6201309.1 virulence RhuM family protein [Cognataquiflexum nitidum]
MTSDYPDFPIVQVGLAQTDIELDLMVSQNSIPSKQSLGGALPFVFKEGEIDKKNNVQKMHIPNSDKTVVKNNRDVIISVGYRVKSRQVTHFRICGNKWDALRFQIGTLNEKPGRGQHRKYLPWVFSETDKGFKKCIATSNLIIRRFMKDEIV